MKTGDSLVGGRLKDGEPYGTRTPLPGEVRPGLHAGRRTGRLPLDPERAAEPQADGYPGTDMPVAQEAGSSRPSARCCKVAARARRSSATTTTGPRIPVTSPPLPPGEDPETDYPYKLLQTSAAKWIAGTAFHCYSGDPSAQTALHEAFPTRGSGSPSAPARTGRPTRREILPRHAHLARAQPHDRHHPQLGQVGRQLEHRARRDRRPAPRRLRHLHRPGHAAAGRHRVDERRVLHDRAPVEVREARCGADREHVVRHHRMERADHGRRVPQPRRFDRARRAQRERRPRSFAVSVGERTFEYTLPGGALATFTWPLRRARRQPRPRRHHRRDRDRDAVGDDASLAIDGDASTRWSSGTAQSPGQNLTIDLGDATNFSRVAIDSGGNLGDYARNWTLETSADGTTWTVNGEWHWSAQLTNIDVASTRHAICGSRRPAMPATGGASRRPPLQLNPGNQPQGTR